MLKFAFLGRFEVIFAEVEIPPPRQVNDSIFSFDNKLISFDEESGKIVEESVKFNHYFCFIDGNLVPFKVDDGDEWLLNYENLNNATKVTEIYIRNPEKFKQFVSYFLDEKGFQGSNSVFKERN
jgi:hypothetical protein